MRPDQLRSRCAVTIAVRLHDSPRADIVDPELLPADGQRNGALAGKH